MPMGFWTSAANPRVLDKRHRVLETGFWDERHRISRHGGNYSAHGFWTNATGRWGSRHARTTPWQRRRSWNFSNKNCSARGAASNNGGDHVNGDKVQAVDTFTLCSQAGMLVVLAVVALIIVVIVMVIIIIEQCSGNGFTSDYALFPQTAIMSD